jgi:protein arginine kinase
VKEGAGFAEAIVLHEGVISGEAALLDHMGRSYGILKHAYSMHSKEALNLLSLAKLGCDLGFYPEEQRQAVDELFMETQPAHLQKGSQQKLAAEERDALRATIIRQKLATCPEPDARNHG